MTKPIYSQEQLDKFKFEDVRLCPSMYKNEEILKAWAYGREHNHPQQSIVTEIIKRNLTES